MPARAAADLPGADEAVLPRARGGLRPDQPDRVRRGGGVPAHPRARARPSSTPRSRARRSPAAATLAGDQAFQLHDTYGFPIDLTLEMAAEQGLEVDREGFTRLMREQRQRAKADAKSKKSGHANTEVWRDLRAKGATDFLAYQELTSEATRASAWSSTASAVDRDRAGPARPGRAQPHPVLRGVRRPGRRRGRHHRRRRAAAGGRRAAAGQGPDRAHRRGRHRPAARRRERAGGGRPRVAAVGVPGALGHARRARGAAPGARPVGPAVRLVQQARLPAARLRLGTGPVAGDPQRDRGGRQPRGARGPAGVGAPRCRCREAREIGALALFGETYGEDVRVVEIGGPWSRELCGGTHVQHSSQIGALTITGESSVGLGRAPRRGVRRHRRAALPRQGAGDRRRS